MLALMAVMLVGCAAEKTTIQTDADSPTISPSTPPPPTSTESVTTQTTEVEDSRSVSEGAILSDDRKTTAQSTTATQTSTATKTPPPGTP